MKTAAIYFWRKLGSINFTVGLCFLLTFDLGVAYFTLGKNLSLFSPLSDVGIFQWIMTYGIYNFKETFWFFALMLLLTLLGINTFICTTERVWPLLRKEFRRPGWFMYLGPHIMHYAVLIILGGYLCSYIFSTSLPGRGLVPGASLKLPQDAGTITFLEYNPIYYRGDRLDFFKDYVLDPGARLQLRDATGRTTEASLAFNRPASFQGYKIYLNEFYPRKDKIGGMGSNYIRLTLRRDQSSIIYLAGLVIFVMGLALYMFEKLARKTR